MKLQVADGKERLGEETRKESVTLSLSAARRAILKGPENGFWSILICGLILTLILSLLYLYPPSFLRFLDLKLYDTLFKSTLPGHPSGVPLIVDLDEKSLAQFGQWPWPRYRVALLLEKLRELGAGSIGLDMVFAEADRTSLGILQKEILRDFGVNLRTGPIPEILTDHDKALARILSRGPFVLGYKFLFSRDKNPDGDCLLHPLNVVVIRAKGTPENKDFLFGAQGAVCNLGVLSRAVSSSGFFNVVPDEDGVLRRVPLLIEYQGKFYPSLSLAALGQALGVKQVSLKMTPRGVESLRLGNAVIPLDPKGNLLVRYRGKGKTFDTVSAGDVLTNTVPRERVQGKIVFVGTSAAGLGEFRSTPLDAVFPGVEVHATLVDNILKKNFFSRPDWAPGVEFLFVLGSGIVSTLLLGWVGAAWSLLALGAGAFGLWQGSQWALQGKGVFLSPLIPLTVLGVNFLLLTSLKYWREERKVRARTKEIVLTQDFTIQCLASLVETRDSETGSHILRTQRYVRALCRRLASRPKYRERLDSETMEFLFKSAPLHDIGKVGVPDRILLKPGRLSPHEFEEMKRHTIYGRDAIQRAEEKFGYGASSSFLRLSKEMAYTHHEKWDGSGYPEGLKGEQIPISGRIMALADVYDSLICRRVYKPSSPHDEAVSIIGKMRGSFFDPEVVDVFLEVHEEFRQICSESEVQGEPCGTAHKDLDAVLESSSSIKPPDKDTQP